MRSEYAAGDTIDFKFQTDVGGTGTALSSGALAVYKANSVTQSTEGITLTSDFDSVTGLHHVRIATTNVFYANGSDYQVVITEGAVSGVNVTGMVVGQFALSAAAGASNTVILGTVDTTGFSPTATEFEADDITEATADHFNGREIIFTSGALINQATDITDYSLSGGRGHFTVTAVTEAPGNNDTFVIV